MAVVRHQTLFDKLSMSETEDQTRGSAINRPQILTTNRTLYMGTSQRTFKGIKSRPGPPTGIESWTRHVWTVHGQPVQI